MPERAALGAPYAWARELACWEDVCVDPQQRMRGAGDVDARAEEVATQLLKTWLVAVGATEWPDDAATRSMRSNGDVPSHRRSHSIPNQR